MKWCDALNLIVLNIMRKFIEHWSFLWVVWSNSNTRCGAFGNLGVMPNSRSWFLDLSSSIILFHSCFLVTWSPVTVHRSLFTSQSSPVLFIFPLCSQALDLFLPFNTKNINLSYCPTSAGDEILQVGEVYCFAGPWKQFKVLSKLSFLQSI